MELPHASNIASHISLYAFLATVSYYVVRSIYRSFFHPLSAYPGPWLAGVTTMYGGYFDLVTGTDMVRQLPQLHKKYGPIVRISPDQLDIEDIDAYNEAFKIGTKYKKDEGFLPFRDTSFGIPDVPAAKKRKDVYMPYFSHAAIKKIEPSLQSIIDRWKGHLSEYSHSGQTCDSSWGFQCLTLDAITQYCFSKDVHAVDHKDFIMPFLESSESIRPSATFSRYFSSVVTASSYVGPRLPHAISRYIFEGSHSFGKFVEDCEKHMRALNNATEPRPINSYPTVFDSFFSTDASKSSKHPTLTDAQLTSEAILFVGAGMDTTGTALITTVWNLIQHPTAAQKLRAELRACDSLDLEHIEHLPYLTAVIKESSRFSYGVPGPIARVVPEGGTVIAGRKIPAGTVVGHSAYVYHNNPDVFYQPEQWNPERWIDFTPEQKKEMERFWMPFSRGSRGCLGMNSAWAELYLAIATLYRTFDVRNAGTTEQDMEWRDRSVTVQKGHLKVKSQKVE